jgi:hypothetical protein
MAHESPASTGLGRIGPPDREPLKVNVFEFMRATGGKLLPLFPYIDAGSIVPAAALAWGGDPRGYGSFIHTNSQDEVVIVFASDGTPGRSGTGMARAGNKTHPVGPFFDDPENRERFGLFAITQRQPETGAAKESVWLLCEACKKEVTRVSFEVTPARRGAQEAELGPYAPFETLPRTAEAFVKFNSSLACPHCGHVNKPLPEERWRLVDYVDQTAAVRRAREVLDATCAVFEKGGSAGPGGPGGPPPGQGR